MYSPLVSLATQRPRCGANQIVLRRTQFVLLMSGWVRRMKVSIRTVSNVPQARVMRSQFATVVLVLIQYLKDPLSQR